jgi:hypothetical protein
MASIRRRSIEPIGPSAMTTVPRREKPQPIAANPADDMFLSLGRWLLAGVRVVVWVLFIVWALVQMDLARDSASTAIATAKLVGGLVIAFALSQLLPRPTGRA